MLDLEKCLTRIEEIRQHEFLCWGDIAKEMDTSLATLMRSLKYRGKKPISNRTIRKFIAFVDKRDKDK